MIISASKMHPKSGRFYRRAKKSSQYFRGMKMSAVAEFIYIYFTTVFKNIHIDFLVPDKLFSTLFWQNIFELMILEN
jgi:hypothetical protein